MGNLIQHHYLTNSKMPISTFNETLQVVQMSSYLFASVQRVNDSVLLNNAAEITTGNLNVTNGLIHVIDHVLDPSAMIFEGDLPRIKQGFIAGSCANPALPYC